MSRRRNCQGTHHSSANSICKPRARRWCNFLVPHRSKPNSFRGIHCKIGSPVKCTCDQGRNSGICFLKGRILQRSSHKYRMRNGRSRIVYCTSCTDCSPTSCNSLAGSYSGTSWFGRISLENMNCTDWQMDPYNFGMFHYRASTC